MQGGLTVDQARDVQALLTTALANLNHDSIRSDLHGVGNPTTFHYEGAKAKIAEAMAIAETGIRETHR